MNSFVGKAVALCCYAFSFNACATTLTFTENNSSTTEYALGYPVPIPVDSTLPIDGFRTYAFLHARHQDMASVSNFITASSIGQTFNGDTIWAYQLSDSDSVTESQIPEPVMLQNGGIHAREWQSPEVVTGIIERFFANEDDQGFYQYLLENTKIVIIPVMNIDGFRQTQRFPTQAMITNFAGDGNGWPRDGRMRRKNMRGVDTDLSSENDNLLGVDLNRNSNQFWAASTNSSSDNRSLVHHGSSPASEPETQALQAAATLGPASRLRFYIDTHSFSQIYFTPLTGNTRRDALTESVVSKMRAVNNNHYAYGPSSAGTGIGATDDYFAYTFQIPSYTLETEPGQNGGAQYGGTGVTHSGFVLPDSEIRRVTDELVNASVLGYYVQAGPPAIKQLVIAETSTGNRVYESNWEAQNGSQRNLSVVTNSGLQSGVEYQARISFNKSMRWRDNNSATVNYPGQNIALDPQVTLEGKGSDGEIFSINLSSTNGHWANQNINLIDRFVNYRDDSYIFNFTVASTQVDLATAPLIQFAFQTTDLSGQPLDSNPATVIDWIGGSWSSYESSDGSLADLGGVDRTLRIADDNSPKFQPPSNTTSSSSGGGSMNLLLALFSLLLLGQRRKRQI